MKLFLSLATCVFIGVVGTANASTIDIFLNNGNVTFNTSANSSTNSSVNIATDPNLVLDNAYLNGATTAHYPGGNTVYFINVFDTGSATFNNLNTKGFSFSWDGVDSSNTITLTDAGATYRVTGAEIQALVGATNQSNVQVAFFDNSSDILKAKLTTGTTEFITSNFGAQVPLPASLPLLGGALLGLGAIARRASFIV